MNAHSVLMKNMSLLRQEGNKQRAHTMLSKKGSKHNVIIEENEDKKRSLSPYRKTHEEAEERFCNLYPELKKKREKQNRILAMIMKNTQKQL